MVAENWPYLSAARRRARSIVEKLDLHPPVDVDTLLRAKAQVEYADWDHECDAVTTLGEDPHRVFVRSGIPPLRERFTIAHELGHIELAWHVGTVDCQVDSLALDDEFSNTQSEGSRQEREANEFASRLLAPDRWLAPLVSGRHAFDGANMRDVLAELAVARMSALAGVIALSHHLLPGHAFFVDESFAISRGTAWPGRPPISSGEVKRYIDAADTVGEFTHQGRRIVWAHTKMGDDSSNVATASLDSRTAHQILVACCTRVFGSPEAADKAAKSINGVVGGVTNEVSLPWNVAAIMAVVRQRIQKHDHISAVLYDDEFTLYLTKRAQSIVDKRAAAQESASGCG
ncbi:ImmA/IrrE family metallo-endopeptidase [Streptomyces sp. GESEQ-13]|uniref:ImmA/IrrE family metallo-endopeptidase n=1 Tax=Streptomyces sp. GESEQ-13 TaxID=2812654 RepID=UPI001B341582